MATRERKTRFIESFGQNALRTAVTEALCFYGDGFLTDEQIDILTTDQVSNAREAQHRMLRNRTARQAEA
jgi:hypothetical protein